MEQSTHSPFPWRIGYGMVIMSGYGKSAVAVATAGKQDAELIVSAVNNTYGQGIDPAKWNVVPDDGSGKKCLNCRHWRDKAWTKKGWGICDNPKNEVAVTGLNMIRLYVQDKEAREALELHFGDSIRFPEDFGCIFFEALEGS